MGTRSTIHVKEGKKTILSIYQQYDGYVEGVGKNLLDFLSLGPVVNGFQTSDQRGFNGPQCLAAQLVANFKSGIGGCYITDAKDRQEFNYFVEVSDKGLTVKVTDWENKRLFAGSLGEYRKYVAKHCRLQLA